MKPGPDLLHALILLAGLSIAFASLQAKDSAPTGREEILAVLGQRQNVGAEVLGALVESERVRVYVGVRSIQFSIQSEPDTTGARVREYRQRLRETRNALLDLVPAASFEMLRQFDNVPGFAGMATAEAISVLSSQPGVWRVDLDEGGSGNALQAQPLASIDKVKSLGYRGNGMTVAVLDSGYDTDHIDLADSLVAEQCFCSGNNCCPNGQATQSGAGSAEDDNGHGTNVAGIITGNGQVAPEGAAPEAAIVAVKVLDSLNRFCCTSDIIAALDWIISERPDVDVVNMSLGTDARYPGDCDNSTAWTVDFATTINTLTTNGVAVVVSSGNNGSGVGMQVPACIRNAISVGAVWDSNVGGVTVLGCTDSTTREDQVTCFSNSSTSTDLFAPGAPYTSTGRGGGMSTYYGTSQAAPTVAACAALLLEETPGLAVSALESALKRSPDRVTDTTNNLTFARLNCRVSLEGMFVDGFESGH